MSLASDFIVKFFGTSTEGPVYLSSLANAENRDVEPGEKHIITRDTADIDAFVRKWDRDRRGMFFCVATVKSGENRRAKETLCELTCLHADIDFKSVEATPDEVDRAVARLQLRPSLVNHSGHGLHLFYLFREAIEATAENVERLEAALRLLEEHVAGDPACSEASRLMRLPGTRNTKFGTPVPVETIFAPEPQPRYELDEMEEWLVGMSPILRRKQPDSAEPAAEDSNPFLAIAGLLGFKPPVDVEQRLAAMRYQGAGDSAIHPTQISISAALLNRGMQVDEVVSLLVAATRAAAGSHAERWNWKREERALRTMCDTWLTKHPEVATATAGAATGTDGAATQKPPDNVVDLAQARKGQQKTASGASASTATKLKKAKAVADMVLRYVQEGGGDLLLTGGDLHLYQDGIWHLATGGDEQRIRVLIQQACEAIGHAADARIANGAWKCLTEHPTLFRDIVEWNHGTHLALQNGVLDVRTGIFGPWKPEYFIRRKLGVTYDRYAKAPRLLEFMDSLFAGRKQGGETIALLQEFFGAALAIDLLDREQRRMLFLVGPSRTGKTELARLLRLLVGEPTASPMCKDIGERFGCACFLNATAWISDDAVSEGDRIDSEKLKKLITGETIEVDRKNKTSVPFSSQIPIVLTANALPVARDSSDAAFNRSLVVDMENVVSENAAIAERRRLGIKSGSLAAWLLDQEGAGIFNWAIEGLERLVKRGKFDIPEPVISATERFKDEGNSVSAWARTCLLNSPGIKVARTDLLASFHGWLREEQGSDSRLPGGRWFLPKFRSAFPAKDAGAVQGARFLGGVALNDEGLSFWQTQQATNDGRGQRPHSSSAESVNRAWKDDEEQMGAKGAEPRF